MSNQYIKIVEWSEEDNCYVGRCPELFGGGVHGKNEAEVYAQLCAAVADVIAARIKHDELPKPVKAAAYSGKFVLRIDPELHKALAIRAFKEGKSLNELCLDSLVAA
ncbi:MAG: toxin-antitoxin system HicB family antitoxin [Verrucomicrobiales bacterium]|jgi:predicted HicB family RNase H-like nuclease|nr:toxin-antitoxin system HicB family antitoxin [Verrucomicrobiales bacterium]